MLSGRTRRSARLLLFLRWLLVWCSIFLNVVHAWSSSSSSTRRPSSSSTYYIAPPRTTREWVQLAELVVNSFEAPAQSSSDFSSSKWEQLQWKIYQRRLSTQQAYRQFVRNARKLKQSKYAVFLAKDQGNVIGMVELGISSTTGGTNNAQAAGSERRATVGVLCVDSKHRERGVASALMDRCEQLVGRPSWGQMDTIYAQVEHSNRHALRFFTNRGYQALDDDYRDGDNNSTEATTATSMVRVRNRNQLEAKPHLLLFKKIDVQ